MKVKSPSFTLFRYTPRLRTKGSNEKDVFWLVWSQTDAGITLATVARSLALPSCPCVLPEACDIYWKNSRTKQKTYKSQQYCSKVVQLSLPAQSALLLSSHDGRWNRKPRMCKVKRIWTNLKGCLRQFGWSTQGWRDGYEINEMQKRTSWLLFGKDQLKHTI